MRLWRGGVKNRAWILLVTAYPVMRAVFILWRGRERGRAIVDFRLMISDFEGAIIVVSNLQSGILNPRCLKDFAARLNRTLAGNLPVRSAL